MKRLTIFLSVLSVLALARPAAAVTSSISGTVTDTLGAALSDICVEARRTNGLDPINYTGYTNPDGDYSVTLTPGTYTVRFSDCSGSGLYAAEYYDGVHADWLATPVEVAGGDAGGIDATLELAGSISGSVTDEVGAPAYALVRVYGYESDAAYAWTDDEGDYSFTGLAPGTYSARFDGVGSHRTEFWDDKTDPELADPIGLSPGELVTGIDAQLDLSHGTHGSSIAGHVYDEHSVPLAGMCASAYRMDGDGYATYMGGGLTGSSGRYELPLESGDYKVTFSDCSHGIYIGEWWDDEVSFEDADVIELAPDSTEIADAYLASKPEADLTISIVEVRNVPIRTDNGPAPVQPGTMREITFEVANAGPAEVSYGSWVDVCPRSYGICKNLAFGGEVIASGGTRRTTVEWDGAGYVGDVTIYANVWADSEAYDPVWWNNYDSRRHYVVVGGTGRGVGVGVPY